MTADLNPAELLRYSRHLMLPEVGLEGQRKLKAASVLVVGTGGLGSPIALYLAAAGVGRLGLVDDDVVDVSNLQRQILHSSAATGRPKVESARTRLADLNPEIEIVPYHTRLTSQNAMDIAAGYDIIVDGTDNFPTRYLLNDLCVLTGKPYIYGSIYRFDGQMSVFDARSGPCYRCLFPAPPPPHLAPTCADGGVLGILPGTIGSLQATETIKLILGAGSPLIGKLLLYDALDLSFQQVSLRKNPHCKVCSAEPEITGLIDYEDFCHLKPADPAAQAALEVTPAELAARLAGANPPRLIDVREPVEQQVSTIAGAELIPYGQILAQTVELDPQAEMVFFCRTGIRGMRVVENLVSRGFCRVASLRGGINAWAREVDPAVRQY
ncbi:MAG TPA: molybdopterin-synthase adenylyltransferase MoeB [Anaerolineaceae bacterium]|nr:molybdopterin-synthase adenylyltransferase MoeB [Anaerolineaceae bacterium]HPN50401.1 molybdopterin-synthase adenylyltransferase MoeB [Anaerolineaceae bacterium]